MSVQAELEPTCQGCPEAEIDLIIASRPRDIGSFTVRRLLPAAKRRRVGPFIFFDHMGPAELPAGRGMDVRPHPHINLATVTYLFEGEIMHRDSVGSNQAIRPGAINWMTAGRGIVHSERTGERERARDARIHGIQLWVALPREHEEVEPGFEHHPADTIPEWTDGGTQVRLLVGDAYGRRAPVTTFSSMVYLEAKIPAGQAWTLPEGHAELAAYLVDGRVTCGDQALEEPSMAVFRRGAVPTLRATSDAHVMVIGGAPLEGERHLFWNFVSSRPERLEQAKADWKAGHFPKVPGDEVEFIPLPEG